MSNLIVKDDSGNWSVKGLPWKDLYVGKVITENTSERLYACLWKLMEYEDTGLSPAQCESLKEVRNEEIKDKYGVYEVYTWDDVSYTKLSAFENEQEALKECERLKTEHKKENWNPDPVSYCVMSDIKYSLMMSN